VASKKRVALSIDQLYADRDLYFQSCLKIVPKNASGLVPLVMKKEQRRLAEVIDRERRNGRAPKIVILKSRRVGACLDPSTRVLTDDLRWVPLSAIEPGQTILATDENIPGGKGGSRKMRRAVVEAKQHVIGNVLRITTDRGCILATPDHRFLVYRAGMYRWKKAASLRPGQGLRFLTEPWGEPDSEDGWFAGMMDGEGCLRGNENRRTGTELSITQNEGPVFDRVVAYLNRHAVHYKDDMREATTVRKRCHKAVCCRTDELLGLVGRCRPTRFTSQAWWAGIELPGKRTGNRPVAKILTIERLPQAVMIDLQTSTRTFIANGFVSHNSTFAEAELFRECHLRDHKRALVVAHELDSAQTIFDMSQLFYDELPEGIKPPTKYLTKKLINFAHNGSRMQVVVAGEARGYTAQYVHISELAFMENAEQLMTAILHTTPDDPESLVIAESTPNGIGNYFHNLWVNAVAKKNDWVPFFSPWHEDETYRMKPWFEAKDLSPHDARVMADHKLDLYQMAWYISTRENKCNGDQDKMDQENPSDATTCFLASGRKVFDGEGLQHCLDTAAAAEAAGEMPPECEIDRNPLDKKSPTIRAVRRGRWRIYREPQRRHRYVAGVDTASGDPGGDYTPIVMLNQHTLDVDAVFYGKLAPDLLAWESAYACWWYNTATVAGEANNQGVLYFDELIRRVKYPNVYYRTVDEKSVYGKVGDKPGFWTSEANRTPLFNLARRYVREAPTRASGRCIDPSILKEFSELFYDDANRVDHPKGGYMDATSAISLALYVHMGSYEATLEPLSLESATKAVTIHRENLARRSMGLADKPFDIGVLTGDDIQKLDDLETRRTDSRKRSGLGGYR
jgi:hypothetical protein